MLTEEEEDDDLNEAKLNNLENEDSNWSSLSVLKLSNNQHNMTTPVNKMAYYNESEDKSIFNNNNMNITENIFKNNVPTSMIYNYQNTDNYDTNAYHFLKTSKSSGLSGGAIAGIVLGSVALAAIIATLIICLRKKPNDIGNNSISRMNLKVKNPN